MTDPRPTAPESEPLASETFDRLLTNARSAHTQGDALLQYTIASGFAEDAIGDLESQLDEMRLARDEALRQGGQYADANCEMMTAIEETGFAPDGAWSGAGVIADIGQQLRAAKSHIATLERERAAARADAAAARALIRSIVKGARVLDDGRRVVIDITGREWGELWATAVTDETAAPRPVAPQPSNLNGDHE